MRKKIKRLSFLCFKKGQDANLLFIVVMLFVIAIMIVAGFKAVKQLNSAVQNMDAATQEVKDMSQRVEDKYVVVWDALFLLILVFLFIILLASAFWIDTHPVFFIISLMLTIVAALVGGHIANAYSTFAEGSNISAEANSFSIIPYIFQHYIAVIVIMGMMTTIVLFAKIRSASSG